MKRTCIYFSNFFINFINLYIWYIHNKLIYTWFYLLRYALIGVAMYMIRYLLRHALVPRHTLCIHSQLRDLRGKTVIHKELRKPTGHNTSLLGSAPLPPRDLQAHESTTYTSAASSPSLTISVVIATARGDGGLGEGDILDGVLDPGDRPGPWPPRLPPPGELLLPWAE
jgi:hypothetical protein